MKRNLKVMLGILFASITILVIVLSQFGIKNSTPDTETFVKTNVSTLSERFSSLKKTSITFPTIELPSYVEICELDYVEPPVKRTVAESVEKIKEMSLTYPGLSVVLENIALYPDEIIKSLAGNPEMVHFAINYLNSDGSVTGGITEEENPKDYPLFLQWDIRWGYMPYGSDSTVGSSGCGPTCLAMAVYYLTGNTACTPDAIAKYSLDTKYYVEGTGTAWALMDNYPPLYGLKVTHPSLREANLKAELDKGNILICSCRPGDFTSEGHFIVIYGYDENGFKINDPKCVYRSRQSWTYKQIKNDIKRTWSIGQ